MMEYFPDRRRGTIAMEFALLKIGEWSRFKADATYIQPSFRLQARTGCVYILCISQIDGNRKCT